MPDHDASSPRELSESRRAARLQLLADVGRKTTAILSREELLRSAVLIIRETFDYFMVNIFLVDGQDLVVAACSMPELQHAVDHLRLRIGSQGITGWVAAHGRPLNVPDVAQDPRYSFEYNEELSTRSELAVPITLKGTVTGVLDVQSTQVGAFTDLDVFTLQTVADQLAIAIENARLYGELRRELAVRRRIEALLGSLHAATLAMELAASPDAVFVTVGEQLARMNLSCALYLVDPARSTVTVAYSNGMEGGGGTGVAAVPGSCGLPVGSQMELGKREAFRRIAGGEPSVFTPGALVAPLLFEDRLLGFLEVCSADLEADAAPALHVFANEIAAAWSKAQLVRDLEESLRQLRTTQEQLLHAQKMEAVGRLAGGVAHDFNNQLTVILGYLEILLEGMPPGDRRRGEIAEIQKAARHAAELTRQLLAYSRKQVLQPRAVDLNLLIEEMRSMLRHLIGEDVRLQTHCDPRTLLVRVDPTQVQQVIVNLAVNSRDAMPSGGTLSIATSFLRAGKNTPQSLAGLPPGDYCLVSVSDTGTGMDEQTMSRLFEPFFTTKERGRGTGLGLSTAYGIVKQSGGFIFCASRPGEGTTFTICLPSITGSAEQGSEAAISLPAGGGTESILVVEDEQAVREIVRRTLTQAGYTVHLVGTGREGMGLLESGTVPCHLVLTDLLLPDGVSGLDLARWVRGSGKDIRLLCVSGYSEQLAAGGQGGLPEGSFLQKPFSPAELLRRVRETLDRPQPSG
jgi:signal transduction histidine kinase/putative methionine-R-sulfoxide reductase with GAF domain